MAFSLSSMADAPRYEVRFAPMETYREVSDLPPRLLITVSIYCFEKVLRPLREEVTLEDGTTLIQTGALILQDLHSVCSQGPGPVEVADGTTYSGKQYRVVSIKSHR